MAITRVTRLIAYAWVVLLAVVVTGPALLPGFALSYDLVFTPRQDLLPGSIGVGGGLPRAVPQDAVVALIETVVPGSLVEKAVLLAIPVLAGTGMLRLVRGTGAGALAATFAIANPFVAQRLVIGHWGFLLAYALVPWAMVIARRLRERGDGWDGLRLALVVAAGSLTPSGSLLLAVVAVPPALLPGSALSARSRVLLAAAVSLTWLPWLVPALAHPAGTGADPAGTAIFALRAEGPGGAIVSALAGGGIWNGEAVLPSRGTALAWVLLVAALGLAAWGMRRFVRALGRVTATWWGAVAVAGLLAALASHLLPGAWAVLIEAVPGAGLARDAHKLLAPWVLLIAAAAGLGGARLAGSVRERSGQVSVLVALAILPVACQPDLVWGAGGRLQAVAYPSDWSVVRDTLAQDPRPGDVASFPWTAFRRYDWNAGRTVLDPAPRWLPRTTVASDDLVVQTPEGLVVVAGDDPRAGEISRLVSADAPASSVATALPTLGIGWALIARGTPGPVPDLPGWDLVVEGPDLALYAAPPGAVLVVSPDVRLVAGVDLAVALLLAGGVLALLIRRVRARGPRPLVP
jgi:hypothetical protein